MVLTKKTTKSTQSQQRATAIVEMKVTGFLWAKEIQMNENGFFNFVILSKTKDSDLSVFINCSSKDEDFCNKIADMIEDEDNSYLVELSGYTTITTLTNDKQRNNFLSMHPKEVKVIKTFSK